MLPPRTRLMRPRSRRVGWRLTVANRSRHVNFTQTASPWCRSRAKKFLPANNKPRASAFLRTPPFPLLFLFVFSSFSLPSRCTNAEDKAIKLWSRAKRDRARASFSPRPFLSFFLSLFFFFSLFLSFSLHLSPRTSFDLPPDCIALSARHTLHFTHNIPTRGFIAA